MVRPSLDFHAKQGEIAFRPASGHTKVRRDGPAWAGPLQKRPLFLAYLKRFLIPPHASGSTGVKSQGSGSGPIRVLVSSQRVH